MTNKCIYFVEHLRFFFYFFLAVFILQSLCFEQWKNIISGNAITIGLDGKSTSELIWTVRLFKRQI